MYWEARRSMRFNLELRQIASDFRLEYLNSSDEVDNTIIPDDWRLEKVGFITNYLQAPILAFIIFSLVETLQEDRIYAYIYADKIF